MAAQQAILIKPDPQADIFLNNLLYIHCIEDVVTVPMMELSYTETFSYIWCMSVFHQK